MKYKLSLAIMGSALLLGGCATGIGPEATIFDLGGGRVTAAGANQLFNPEMFEKIDILNALDPKNKRNDGKDVPRDCGDIDKGQRTCDAEAKKELQDAYEAFYRYEYEGYGDLELRRNRIQDQIILASQQRCNLFKTFIKRVDTKTKSFTGSMATLLGGMGAIFTPASTARALSGSSAIFSGIGAEITQAYFSNVATHVIVPGIEAQRKTIRDAIGEKQLASIQDYPVEMAIADAVSFHGACSIDVGLKAAGNAIKEVRNPGLATMNKALINMAWNRQIADGIKTGEIKPVKIGEEIAPMDNSPVSITSLPTATPPSSLSSSATLRVENLMKMPGGLPMHVLFNVKMNAAKRLSELKAKVRANAKNDKLTKSLKKDLDNTPAEIDKAIKAVTGQLESLDKRYSAGSKTLIGLWGDVLSADKDQKEDKARKLDAALLAFWGAELAKLNTYWIGIRKDIETALAQNKEEKFDKLLETVQGITKKKI
uniref:Uncharacterized protein n=1 Tax=Candidatus Kentrum sp. SD TaxID=2126332 RepID=A0A450YXW9_9GAMM|nr:MAG: hypothetical protein BECKSD772F_GA0070984_10708 [Candidatus Kentron sp. SD]VFK46388.1 MAG: hypothetical protein BECKSD772E_GA0070983_10728 [Candidatus Kentron sp. SD]